MATTMPTVRDRTEVERGPRCCCKASLAPVVTATGAPMAWNHAPSQEGRIDRVPNHGRPTRRALAAPATSTPRAPSTLSAATPPSTATTSRSSPGSGSTRCRDPSGDSGDAAVATATAMTAPTRTVSSRGAAAVTATRRGAMPMLRYTVSSASLARICRTAACTSRTSDTMATSRLMMSKALTWGRIARSTRVRSSESRRISTNPPFCWATGSVIARIDVLSSSTSTPGRTRRPCQA